VKGYRPDIDGLRAIAVLSVVLFHFDYHWFSGGYVGVDVFFVISGFLITQLITQQSEASNFSFLNFYERRIRRLFPAVVLILVSTLLAGYLLLLPTEYSLLAKHQIGALSFAANVVFWRSSGYFTDAAETFPLLHLWSLGVEEQFYFIFPAVLIFLINRRLVWLLGFVFFGSLALSGYLSLQKPTFSFYMLPTRCWELGIGAALALNPPRPPRGVLRNLVGLISVGAILFSILTFDRQTVFPGFHALIPCLGTAGLLWINSQGSSIFYRVLSFRPLVFIGLISYSLYLWHWPILVFSNLASYGMTEPFMPDWLIWVVIFSLAALTWQFVEKPFRRTSDQLLNRRNTFISLGTISVVLIIINLTIIREEGFKGRLNDNSLRALAAKQNFSPHRQKCHQSDGYQLTYETSCVYNQSSEAPQFLLWGDSHGVELADALSKNLKEVGQSIRAITYSSCPPIIGYKSRSSLGCEAHNTNVLTKISADPSVQEVILVASYSSYLPQNGSLLTLFKSTVELLLAAGKKVVIVLPIPHAPWPVPEAFARSSSRTGTQELHFPLDLHLKKSIGLIDEIKAWGLPIQVFDPTTTLCNSDVCSTTQQGEPLYFDSHHLSMFGAQAVADDLMTVLHR